MSCSPEERSLILPARDSWIYKSAILVFEIAKHFLKAPPWDLRIFGLKFRYYYRKCQIPSPAPHPTVWPIQDHLKPRDRGSNLTRMLSVFLIWEITYTWSGTLKGTFSKKVGNKIGHLRNHIRYFQKRVVAKLGTFGTIRYFFKKSGRKIERLRKPIRYFAKSLVAKLDICGTL